MAREETRRSDRVTAPPPGAGRDPVRKRRQSMLIIGALIGGFVLLELLRPYRLPDPVLDARGSPATLPPIQFQDETGRELTLKDFTGRVVLLNLWATWCPPCLDEMPSLDALQRAVGHDGQFDVVAIATDGNDAEAIRGFYDRLEIRSLAIYVDRRGTVGPALGVTGLPATLLLDREGREVGRTTGPADWSGDGARSLILQHIQPDTSAYRRNTPQEPAA